MTHRRVENNRIGQSGRIIDVVQHHHATDIDNAIGKIELIEMIGHIALHDDAIVIVWSKTEALSR